jgi:hypothetical protein
MERVGEPSVLANALAQGDARRACPRACILEHNRGVTWRLPGRRRPHHLRDLEPADVRSGENPRDAIPASGL